MSWHLLPGTMNPNFRLHVDEDPTDVMQRLRDGAANDQTVDVQIVPADRLDAATLTLNPSRMTWWTVMERPDQDN